MSAAAEPNRWRWRRVALVGGGVGFVVVAGIVAWYLATGGALARRITAIRAAGDPASIAELAPKPIPRDKNAAAVIDDLREPLERFDQAMGAFYNSDLGKEYAAAQDAGAAATPEQLAAIRAMLEAHSELDEGMARAAARDRYASLADFAAAPELFMQGRMDELLRFRTLARYAAWRIEILRADGDADDAVHRGIALLRAAKLHASEPTASGYLVSLAVQNIAVEAIARTLSAGAPGPDTRKALDEALAHQTDPQALSRVLQTERAFSISVMTSQTAAAGPWLAGVAGLVSQRFFLGVLDFFDAALPVIDRPWYVPAAPQRAAGPLSRTKSFGTMGDLLAPSIRAVYEAHTRTIALVRSLRVLNALGAYANTHGREASGLDELGLPAEATVDPFSGESLKLRRTEGGWKVYSVGKDGVDDGGTLNEEKDVGVGK